MLLAVAFGLGCAATLAAPAWPWPARRPRTLALAAIVGVATPLSGHALLAAALAIVAVSLALVRDHRTPGGRRVTHWGVAAALGLAAFAAAIAGVALAESHPLHPSASRTAAATPAPAKPANQTPANAHHRETPRAQHNSTHHQPAPSTNGKPAPSTDGKAAPPAHGEAPPATDPQTPGSADPAPTAPAERGSADPAALPAVDADGAIAFVRDYYAALDEQRFDDAWGVLSPAVQHTFGSFAKWKAGYAQTTQSEPRELTTRPAGDALIVNLRLVAHEKNCDALQTFRVTWRLEQQAGGWHVASLQGTALQGRSCE